MKIRRMTILGCSLLFGTLACDSDTGSNGTGKTDVVQQDTAVADGVGQDVPISTDTGIGNDVATVDIGPGDDTVVTDTGGTDTGGGPDTAGPDTTGPDVAGEDAGGGPDVAGEDVAGPDVVGEDIQTGDTGTSEDVAGPDTTGPDATTTVKAGDPCNEEPWTAICDETTKDVELVCMTEKWNTPQQLDLFACFCDESGPKPKAVCAVPGFVGIAEAGRSRVVTTRLRNLA